MRTSCDPTALAAQGSGLFAAPSFPGNPNPDPCRLQRAQHFHLWSGSHAGATLLPLSNICLSIGLSGDIPSAQKNASNMVGISVWGKLLGSTSEKVPFSLAFTGNWSDWYGRWKRDLIYQISILVNYVYDWDVVLLRTHSHAWARLHNFWKAGYLLNGFYFCFLPWIYFIV